MADFESLITGDSRHIPLPDGHVNCVITSPPYWALRKYDIPDVIWGGEQDCEHEWATTIVHKSSKPKKWGTSPSAIWEGGESSFCSKCDAWKGQLGLEPTPELYITHMLEIFKEVKRILRDDGTLFVNLGDSYVGSGIKGDGLKQKSLVGIPERFMLAMLNDGWILRNKIVWGKPNCMPSSASDRFTVDWEPIYFFVKQEHYYFDRQFEPHKSGTYENMPAIGGKKHVEGESNFNATYAGNAPASNPLGRNKRCVWEINTHPYPESHFAVFPEELVKPMIISGCPEFICTKCGTPRTKIIKSEYLGEYDHKKFKSRPDPRDGREFKEKVMGKYVKEDLGYSDCGCNAEWRPGIVLDPFAGSGTTVVTAMKLNRKGIGVDLGYQDLSKIRVCSAKSGFISEME